MSSLTVEKAKKSGKIKIVSFDWLEDSLLSHSKRPKPEKAFLWSTLLRESEGAATKKLTSMSQYGSFGVSYY